MAWFAAGLVYAFFNSIVIFLNQKFQMNAFLLGMWRGFGSVLIALPFVFFVSVPTGKLFFLCAVLQGIMVGYFDYKLFSSSAKFGADGTSLVTVFAIVISVIAWWMIGFHHFMEMVETPKVFIGIVVSLAGCIGGYMFLVGSKLSKKLLIYMLPGVITLALMTVNTKFIYKDISFQDAVVYYMLVIGGVGGLFNLCCYAAQKKKGEITEKLFSRRNVMGGVSIVAASVFLMISKGYAMMSIPNPGYLNILALTSPIWVVLINRVLKVENKVSIPAAVFVLASIGSLVYFSNLPIQPMPY